MDLSTLTGDLEAPVWSESEKIFMTYFIKQWLNHISDENRKRMNRVWVTWIKAVKEMNKKLRQQEVAQLEDRALEILSTTAPG